MSGELLEVVDLTKTFATGAGPVQAVRRISFAVPRGQTVGLVGESGSGKSTVARLLLRLERPTSGTVSFDGLDLGTASKAQLAGFRQRAQMVFQNPYGSLLPHFTALANVAEPLRLHGIGDSARRAEAATALLDRVGVTRRAASLYPRQFSGGQQQRIAIARALVLEPDLLVCDEPTSSLDVSVQAQILALLGELQTDLGLTCVFISHNLAVIERMASYVVVMCRGLVVEAAPTAALFERPRHPYTRNLLAATLPVESERPQVEPVDWDPESLASDDLVLRETAPGHLVLTAQE